MLEVRQDFIRTAHAKGLSADAGAPRVAQRADPGDAVAGCISALLGGAFVVEAVFGLPGMGRLGSSPFSLATSRFAGRAAVVVAAGDRGKVLIDLLHAWLDPEWVKHDG